MERNIFYLILLCIYLEKFGTLGNDICKNEPRCLNTKTHGMKSVDCFRKDFDAIPKCIPSDVEVLDLSFNRIRKLKKSDLSKFSHLKFMYLNENFFGDLPNDTFEDMSTLISLDLSRSSLKVVPTSVFQLPRLNKLSLRQNSELNMAASVEGVKPISSPITIIDMSSISDQNTITEFPDFGLMPYLVSINISENWFHLLTPKHFAGLCSLHTLINNNVSNKYENNCDCWLINKWLSDRNVKFKTFVCPIVESECRSEEVNPEDKSIYNECLQIVQAIQQQHRITKICIGLGVSALIIILILGFVYFYFIRRRRSKNSTNGVPLKGAPLLNNHLNTK